MSLALDFARAPARAPSRKLPSAMGLRAHALIDVRSKNDEKRIIEGVASTPSLDLYESIIEPMGAVFRLPMPLLWQHMALEPVGHVLWAKPNKDGIPFRAQIEQIDEAGLLKDSLDRAWHTVKLGLVRGLSIGFVEREYSFLDDGTLHILEWEWLELSLVTIPANSDCSIETIRSIDRRLRAASGNREMRGRQNPAGVAASRKPSLPKDTAVTVKTLAQRKAELEATLTAKQTQRTNIVTRALDEGRTKTDKEQDEFDTLSEEIDTIAREIGDIEKCELGTVVKRAKPVAGGSEREAIESRETNPNPARQTMVLGLNSNMPKHVPFARHVKCLFNAGGNREYAAQLAEKHYPDDKRIAMFCRYLPDELRMMQRAAVPAGITTAAGWAQEIAQANMVGNDFIEFARGRSIIDRFGQNGVPALRRADFNVNIGKMSGGTTGGWVGEALPIPMSKGTTAAVSLGKTKVAGLTAISKELLRFSAVNSELQISTDLAKAVTQAADSQFASATAATANVKPAGLAAGLTPITPTGTGTADDVRADLGKLFDALAAGNISRRSVVVVTNESLAFRVAEMHNALGTPEFPGLANDGNRISSFYLLSSSNVAGGDVFMISAEDIFLADDGEVEIVFSEHASLEMADSGLTQTGVAGTGVASVSMFQTDSVAIRCIRAINWAKARAEAVSFIGAAGWGGAPTA